MQTNSVAHLNRWRDSVGTAAVRAVGDGFLIDGERGLEPAGLAFSCLVQPRVGDTVLAAWTPEGTYILSILQRPDRQDMTLAFPGNAQIEAAHGELGIATSEGLDLASAKAARLTAATLAVTALRGNIHADEATVSGKLWTGHFEGLSVFAGRIASVVDSVFQRLKDCVRVVEGVDQQSAGDLLHTVRNTFSVRSRYAGVSAREDVRIDGERIHMG